MIEHLKQSKEIEIAVCDDGDQDRSTLTTLITSFMAQKDVLYSLHSFTDGKELVQAINNQEIGCEILFLDVMMDQMDGMETAKAMQNLPISMDIIFVSSNREMALHGYEVNALRYLAKPVSPPLLEEALGCALERLVLLDDITFPTATGDQQVPLADILYVEPWKRQVRVACTERSIQVDLTFSKLVEQMENLPFSLSHRTVLVNLAQIQTIQQNSVLLKNGEELPLSRYRLQELRREFLEYLSK